MSAIEQEVASAAAWLKNEAARVPFGEVSVKLVMHAGRPSRVERTVTTKEQPQEGRDGHRPAH